MYIYTYICVYIHTCIHTCIKIDYTWVFVNNLNHSSLCDLPHTHTSER